MTDRATERLAKALEVAWLTDGATGGIPTFKEIATYLTAQGFGHREDHVRAFAFWLETTGKLEPRYDADVADEYLAIEDKT